MWMKKCCRFDGLLYFLYFFFFSLDAFMAASMLHEIRRLQESLPPSTLHAAPFGLHLIELELSLPMEAIDIGMFEQLSQCPFPLMVQLRYSSLMENKRNRHRHFVVVAHSSSLISTRGGYLNMQLWSC
ncbi:MAG: hypothetical protein MZW92_02845 [Comamonadaceae bacterium]|nr:hypothetical protein [Comamonadaceae bacterium]